MVTITAATKSHWNLLHIWALMTLSGLGARTGLVASPLTAPGGPPPVPRPRPPRPPRGPPRPRPGRPRSPKLISSWEVMSLAGLRKWCSSSTYNKSGCMIIVVIVVDPSAYCVRQSRFLPSAPRPRDQSLLPSYPERATQASTNNVYRTYTHPPAARDYSIIGFDNLSQALSKVYTARGAI